MLIIPNVVDHQAYAGLLLQENSRWAVAQPEGVKGVTCHTPAYDPAGPIFDPSSQVPKLACFRLRRCYSQKHHCGAHKDSDIVMFSSRVQGKLPESQWQA